MINKDSVISRIVRLRQTAGEVRRGLLDIEIELADAKQELLDVEVELDGIEQELRAEQIRRMQFQLSGLDLTGPNVDASARAAEEYRATGSSDPEDYVLGGEPTA